MQGILPGRLSKEPQSVFPFIATTLASMLLLSPWVHQFTILLNQVNIIDIFSLGVYKIYVLHLETIANAIQVLPDKLKKYCAQFKINAVAFGVPFKIFIFCKFLDNIF